MSLFDHIQDFGAATAVLEAGDLNYSYVDLARDADHVANSLNERSLVAVITDNKYASLAGYVGFLRKSVVPILLPKGTSRADLESVLNKFEPDFIYSDGETATDFELGQAVSTLQNYGLYPTPNLKPTNIYDALALLLTTSGSTGSKSYVRLSDENLESNTRQISQYLNLRPEDRAITTMPMSYSYGLSIINSHLVSGGSLVMTEETLVSPQFWSLIKEQKVTNFGGVPFIYEMLKKLRFSRMDLPHLRYITQAGGKLPADLVRYFSETCQDKGIDFFVMYGQTEATARLAYMPPEKLSTKTKSVGVPVPGIDVWLCDEVGNKIVNQQSGELVFKGPNVSLGYAEKSEDLTKGDENCGVLYTGDIAEIDADGFIYIVGRKKRFLKLYGNRINLAEVEDLLLTHGFTAACLGEDDNMYICLENCKDTQVVKRLIQTETTMPPKGYSIVSVDKIPRSESGKVSYHLLMSEIAAQ
jgi:long-chain acyl-CoA synthetase